MSTALICLLAVGLDAWLGEPKRFHPLIGFGNCANWVERHLNLQLNKAENQWRGGIALCFVLLPAVAISYWLTAFGNILWLLELIALYLAIAPRALADHAQKTYSALADNKIELARRRVTQIVSRDTHELSETQINQATIESVLENGADAIFCALFWFLVAGLPGVVLYRLSNTLDAMWGYRSQRYLRFGWAAARLDDLLNYIPARLTAWSYACAGNYGSALLCWKQQAPHWYSPNAGPVMAAGAGALGVQLGGDTVYHGELKQRPTLGQGNDPTANDILRSIRLVREALALWLLIIFFGGWLLG